MKKVAYLVEKEGNYGIQSIRSGVGIMVDSGKSKQAHHTLDCIGLYCPIPVLETRREMDKLAVGEILEVLADDLAAEDDLKAWAKRTGQKILEIRKTSEGMRFFILKEK